MINKPDEIRIGRFDEKGPDLSNLDLVEPRPGKRDQTSQFQIFESQTILDALKKIDRNKSGSIFVTDAHQAVIGAVTDGDIRRWLIQNPELSAPVKNCVNRQFLWFNEDVNRDFVRRMLNSRISIIPILDRERRLIDVITENSTPFDTFSIGSHVIGGQNPCFVIAEVGNNHNGDMARAKQLIDLAVEMEANCVKFQIRNMKSVYRQKTLNNEGNDLSTEYTLDLLRRFNLSPEQHQELSEYCHRAGILYMCTPWDIPSARFLTEIGVKAFKVASADLTNIPLIEHLISTGKPLIISTGMSSENEIQQTVSLLKSHSASFALLHCNSTYPAPAHAIQLNYMDRLRSFHSLVGYSGHERGIHISLAAVAKGAKVLERHFTLDRTMEGPDHAASLEYQDFSNLIKGVREVELAIGHNQTRSLSQGELMNRDNLGKSLVAKVPLRKGQMIGPEHVEVKSPGQGLSPGHLTQLIGTTLNRDIEKEDFFFMSDISGKRSQAKPYDFLHRWGVPVRFHDLKQFTSKVKLPLVEFHLSYQDLDLDPSQYLESYPDMDVIVHAPESFAGGHIMDLASSDENYRQHSINEMRRVIDITLKISKYFKTSGRPRIVTNIGGWSIDRFMTKKEKQQAYKNFEASIRELNATQVAICPQTMPPFPWHMGGQRFHNLFVEPDEIVEVCEKLGLQVVLDLSHSKLACNLHGTSIAAFIERIIHLVTHLHLADAEGLDAEGLPVGKGEIDFYEFFRIINEEKHLTFIPETWQGHKNQGEGFWSCLEKLEEFHLQVEAGRKLMRVV